MVFTKSLKFSPDFGSLRIGECVEHECIGIGVGEHTRIALLELGVAAHAQRTDIKAGGRAAAAADRPCPERLADTPWVKLDPQNTILCLNGFSIGVMVASGLIPTYTSSMILRRGI